MKRAVNLFLAIVMACVAIGANADNYVILKLNTPTITIGGKELKVGDTFNGDSNVRWESDKQLMEVKNSATGALYKFSKRIFDSKGAVLSVADFFLRTNKASTRDGGGNLRLVKSNRAADFPEKRLALVMGNSNYCYLPYLKNAQKDAADIADALLDLGFDVLEIYESDFSGMMTALNGFSAMGADYDVMMLYYAGHGLQFDGKNFLIPVEATLESVDELKQLVHADEVVEMVDGSKASTRLFFIDACRNIKYSWSDGTQGLARMEGTPGAVIVFSTQAGNVALDGEDGNSPFAAAMLRHLPVGYQSFADGINAIVRQTYEATSNRQYPLVVGTLLTEFRFNPASKGAGEQLEGVEVNIGRRKVNELFSQTSPRETSGDNGAKVTADANVKKLLVSNPYVKVNLYDAYVDGDEFVVTLQLTNTGPQTIVTSVIEEDELSDAETAGTSVKGSRYKLGRNLRVEGPGAYGKFALPPNKPVKMKITLQGFHPGDSIDFLTISLKDFDSRQPNGIGSIIINRLGEDL